MRLIDTNILLRYLLGSVQPGFEQAAKAVADGAKILSESIMEATFVLKKCYSLSRPRIAESLSTFLDDVEIDQPGVIRRALEIYGETNLDYADCLLLSRREVLGEDFITFDKKLNAAKNRQKST